MYLTAVNIIVAQVKINWKDKILKWILRYDKKTIFLTTNYH